MCIPLVCQPGCDVINFEINLISLIKPLLYMTKNAKQKLKYLKNEKSFPVEKKTFFIIFKGLSVAKNYLRPESAQSKATIETFSELIRFSGFKKFVTR